MAALPAGPWGSSVAGSFLVWPPPHPLDPEGPRRLHRNRLIALTARRIGAAVVTTDRDHFQRLPTEVAFSRIPW